MKNLIAVLFCLSSGLVLIKGQTTTNYGPNSGTSGPNSSYFGYKAGELNTSEYNSFFGANAGKILTAGTENSFFGAFAGGNADADGLNLNTYNSFFGSLSGLYNSGTANSFFGSQSGTLNSTGGGNCFFGYHSGNQNTTGIGNCFMGSRSGYNNNGLNNVFLGNHAGFYNTTGNNNIVIGAGAHKNSTGSQNIYIGAETGLNNETGSNNVFLGNSAGYYETNTSNTLFIHNSNASIPLIYGEFDNKKIGINTRSIPNGYALGVKGKIITEEVKVQLTNGSGIWPDYVFSPTYQLKPLHILEMEIKEKGHLPEIPSAKDVEENGGIELGDINIKLLKKIEELTLYMIGLQKETNNLKLKQQEFSSQIKDLEEENEQLKKKLSLQIQKIKD